MAARSELIVIRFELMAARAEAMLARLALMMVRFGLMVGCWCCFGRMTDLRGNVAGFFKANGIGRRDGWEHVWEGRRDKEEGQTFGKFRHSLSLSLSCIRWSKGDGKIACLGMGQTRISAALRQNPCMDSSRLKIPFFAVLLPSATLKVSKDERDAGIHK